MASLNILAVNCGSSSIKSCLFDASLNTRWDQHLQWEKGFVNAQLDGSKVSISSIEEGLTKLLSSLPNQPDIVVHRVVHGGSNFTKEIEVNQEVLAEIETLIPLAPLHNPSNLAGIRHAKLLFPKARQFAFFDTAFHTTIPKAHAIYPGPYSWFERGIRRYGFHGLSHHNAAEEVSRHLGSQKRHLNCHLGAGASLCAIQEGKSLMTTMGFTPLEGLMMATRSGSVDPGILVYLGRKGSSFEELDHLLNFESGFLGLSGISDDLRILLKSKETRAKLAIDVFLARLQEEVGRLIGLLKGLDCLTFTAGIGENSPFIRERVCASLDWLGVELDLQKNQSDQKEAHVISKPHSNVQVLVIPASEELFMARHCLLSHCNS